MPSVPSFLRRDTSKDTSVDSTKAEGQKASVTESQGSSMKMEEKFAEFKRQLETIPEQFRNALQELVSNQESEGGQEYRDMLLRNVKREVKQIMEEAVTRKFIHEESSGITSLCASVESCLQYGLKRRALGLFREGSTLALLYKVSKTFEPAELVVRRMSEQSSGSPVNGGSPWNGASTPVGGNGASDSLSFLSLSSASMGLFQDSKKGANSKKVRSAIQQKYLWIRIALFEKVLAKIVDHLVANASKYYDKESIIGDASDGSLLASLLAGPCALEYTRMKTCDHLWTDPPADELVQRHRIHSSGPLHHQPGSPVMGACIVNGTGSPKKPSLMHSLEMCKIRCRQLKEYEEIRRHTSSSSEDSGRSAPPSAKEYVESLHQNTKSTLLYGKNNVHVQPREDVGLMAGYLSLHQGIDGVSLKWTPNQLMSGCPASEMANMDAVHGSEQGSHQTNRRGSKCSEHLCQMIARYGRKPLYWDYALTIRIDEVVYLHCHQQVGRGGTVVLVGQDGIQHPPVHFPAGGHLLAFLSCLETGLHPEGYLDPPLWSQKGKGWPILDPDNTPLSSCTPNSYAGKVFPRLKRRSTLLRSGGLFSDDALGGRAQSYDVSEGSSSPGQRRRPEKAVRSATASGTSFTRDENQEDVEEEEPTDYVFRIVFVGSNGSLDSGFDSGNEPRERTVFHFHRESSSSGASQDRIAMDPVLQNRTTIQQLCDTMRRQILSRGFYGWLAHVRHLKTVRTHLSALVKHAIVPVDRPCDASKGVTKELWQKWTTSGTVSSPEEVYRHVYYGGCERGIRKLIWPYLLGHYSWTMTQKERTALDEQSASNYEASMAEWLAVEAIVRQRDQDLLVAKLRSVALGEDQQGPLVPPMGQSASNHEDNDVFEEGKLEFFTQLWDSLKRRISQQSDSIPPLQQIPPSTEGSAGHSLQGTPTGDSNGVPGMEEESSQTEQGTNKNNLSLAGLEDSKYLSTSRESLVSPASPASHGGIYSSDMLDQVALNLQRIDKDVTRCDRSYVFFTSSANKSTSPASATGIANLDKLRNIMCTYVWEHLEIGYVQGMCDLLAPLLVVFGDEAMAHACFSRLMERMTLNFPHGGAMDRHFENMRSLIQILDPDMFEHMQKNGDYSHFYFCYRWFLLDFKRELVYEDVFSVWETIWAARETASEEFVLFLALALVEYYQEIIIDNDMDFTDIIKFFNEMAERHNVKQLLCIARNLVYQLQALIENQ